MTSSSISRYQTHAKCTFTHAAKRLIHMKEKINFFKSQTGAHTIDNNDKSSHVGFYHTPSSVGTDWLVPVLPLLTQAYGKWYYHLHYRGEQKESEEKHLSQGNASENCRIDFKSRWSVPGSFTLNIKPMELKCKNSRYTLKDTNPIPGSNIIQLPGAHHSKAWLNLESNWKKLVIKKE